MEYEHECAFCGRKFKLDGQRFADFNVEGRAWCRKCDYQEDPDWHRKVYGNGDEVFDDPYDV